MSSDLLTKHQLSARLALSVRTLERLVKAGQFPPPERRGRLSCWYVGAVDAWQSVRLDQQIEAARTSAVVQSKGSRLAVTDAGPVNPPSVLAAAQKSASSSIYTEEDLAAAKMARQALASK